MWESFERVNVCVSSGYDNCGIVQSHSEARCNGKARLWKVVWQVEPEMRLSLRKVRAGWSWRLRNQKEREACCRRNNRHQARTRGSWWSCWWSGDASGRASRCSSTCRWCTRWHSVCAALSCPTAAWACSSCWTLCRWRGVWVHLHNPVFTIRKRLLSLQDKR